VKVVAELEAQSLQGFGNMLFHGLFGDLQFRGNFPVAHPHIAAIVEYNAALFG